MTQILLYTMMNEVVVPKKFSSSSVEELLLKYPFTAIVAAHNM